MPTCLNTAEILGPLSSGIGVLTSRPVIGEPTIVCRRNRDACAVVLLVWMRS